MHQLNLMIANIIEFTNARVAAAGVYVNQMDRLKRSFESRIGLQRLDVPPVSGAPSRSLTPTDTALRSPCPRDQLKSRVHLADQTCIPKPQQTPVPQLLPMFVSPFTPIPVLMSSLIFFIATRAAVGAARRDRPGSLNLLLFCRRKKLCGSISRRAVQHCLSRFCISGLVYEFAAATYWLIVAYAASC